MKQLEIFFGAHLWTLHVLVALALTFVAHLLTSRLILKLAKQAEKQQVLYAEAFLRALYKPLAFFIWLLGLSIAAALSFPNQHDHWIFTYLAPLKKTGIIFAITWAAVRFIKKVETLTIQNTTKRIKDMDETVVHAFALLLTITVVVIGGMSIMQLFGLPLSGLLAFGGIGGAGIAFASKDLLANFFGGLVVYLDKPFKVGHWVRSPDKNIEGIVEHIGWRVTRIRTFEKRPLYVPNSFFLNISVENATRMLNCRIKTIISIRYQDADKIETLTQELKHMLVNHDGVDKKQIIMVHLTELGTSSLDILVDACTKATKRVEYQAVRHDILIHVLRIIEANNAECAFPTQTLFLESQDGSSSLC